VSELLDYSAEELTGKNLYALCHGEDANKLRKSHVDRKLSYYDPFQEPSQAPTFSSVVTLMHPPREVIIASLYHKFLMILHEIMVTQCADRTLRSQE
jgi:hypothetical protein